MQYIAPCCYQTKLFRILDDNTHNPSGLWKDGSFYNYICLNCGKLFYIEDGYKEMTIQEQIKELKTKLEQQNKEMLNKIAELEKQAKAEEKQSRVWKPKKSEKYCCLFGHDIGNDIWTEKDVDQERFIRGTVFKTKEEAEWADQHRIVETELKHFVAENDPNPITEEDWEDSCVEKHYIYYDYGAREIFPSHNNTNKIANQVYASDVETLEKAITHIGDERLKKYYFGVKK